MKRKICLPLILAALLLCACQTARPESAPEAAAAPEAAVATPEPTPTAAPEPTPEPTPEPDARQVELEISCGAERLFRLTDDNFGTGFYAQPGAELHVAAAEPVSGIYLLWDTYPEVWELSYDNTVVTGGEEGFLHEYLPLPEPTAEFTIRLPEGVQLAISDIYAFTEGVLPAWVQRWQPPCETADLLLFPTHADDEYIFFGGIIPTYAGERGLEVQVAYMVDHYTSQRFRCHEMLNGLWTAGLRHYPVTGDQRDGLFSDFADAYRFYGEEAIVRFQVEQIRRFQPLVVVGHAETGEYGNPAHMLNTYCLEKAVELTADETNYPESAEQYGLWDTPKLYIHLYGEERTVLDYDTALEGFEGKTAYEVAMEAYARHLSQQQWSFTVYGPDYPQYDSHSFGLYRSLVGEDVAKNELFENIDPSDWR